MKRIVTIQDISCFGRCSQTVALPILSALGTETVILPTAVLSTHTGQFKDYTFLSLQNEMPNIISHWKKENITFDAIYIGYIGNISMIDVISKFIDDFSDDNTIIHIDPAMADNAKLYSGLDNEYVNSVKNLCKKATVISPNIYEAMLLAYGECQKECDLENAKDIIDILSSQYNDVIITGIHDNDKIFTIGKPSVSDEIYIKENKKIDGMFYGTGDIFSSVFIGTLLNGLDFCDAISFADDFVWECINNTLPESEKYWYGINFEKCMYLLTDFSRSHNI